MARPIALVFIFSLACGCSNSSPEPAETPTTQPQQPAQQPQVDPQQEALKSWDEFVEGVKARMAAAKKRWRLVQRIYCDIK